MRTDDELDAIDRIHDDEPENAADRLRALDARGVDVQRLPLLAFLLAHVLGEKQGKWAEAAQRLEALRSARNDAPLPVAVHAAVAAGLSGEPRGDAFATLAERSGPDAADIAVELGKLGFAAPAAIDALAERLELLARRAQALDTACALDSRLAAGFNNATTQLLDRASPPLDDRTRSALVAGAAAALRFWRRAGTWVQHERALYLQALVFNRIGEPAAARDACSAALTLIAANGTEEIDQAFLQLQLAGALIRLGDAAAGDEALRAARAAAATWDDGLKSWFAEEHDQLFGHASERQE